MAYHEGALWGVQEECIFGETVKVRRDDQIMPIVLGQSEGQCMIAQAWRCRLH